MGVRMERLRVLVIIVAVAGVVVAAINTMVGAILLGAVLAVLVIAALASWLTEPDEEGQEPEEQSSV